MNNSTEPEVDHDPQLIAIKGMSTADREHFKQIGKDMYGHLKFKGVKLMDELDSKPDEQELVAYICRQLDDGIHPSMLSTGEHKVLADSYGPKWYEKWRYVVGDLDDIVTFDRT